jgi:putative transposase
VLNVSERRACRALGQHRSTQRKAPRGKEDEEQPTADLIELARQYGRYGYRKISALLRDVGWVVNDKRVERIWRREGLKVPPKQPKRSRLWLTDGSCIRLRPEYPNQVWSYDFVEDRTHDGRKFRMLNVIDEFTHECLAIRVDRKLKAIDVIDVLSDLFILRGVPTHIRSDNVLRREGERRTGQQVSIGLQASRSGGVCARLRGLAGCAIPTGFAGQAPRSTQTTHALTFTSDHPMGADHYDPGHRT